MRLRRGSGAMRALLRPGNGAAAVIMGATGHFVSAQAVFFVTAGFTLPALAALFRIRDSEVNAASAHGGITAKEQSRASFPAWRCF